MGGIVDVGFVVVVGPREGGVMGVVWGVVMGHRHFTYVHGKLP